VKKCFILLLFILSNNLLSLPIKGTYEKNTKKYKKLRNTSCLIKLKDKSLCSGSIIKEDKILTAAHCLYNKINNTEKNIDEILCGPKKIKKIFKLQ
jgi:hypothetical protein